MLLPRHELVRPRTLGPVLVIALAACHAAPEATPDHVDSAGPQPATTSSAGPVEPDVEPTPTPPPSIEYDGPCPTGMTLVDGGTFTDAQWKSLSARFDPSGLKRDIEPFCMAVLEVTNADFRDCANADACVAERDYDKGTYGRHLCVGSKPCDPLLADKPVSGITPAGADAYCRFRGGRVPSISEWFWASMGGTEDRRYPWGDAPLDATRLNVCDESCRLAECDDTEGSVRRECLSSYRLHVAGDDGFAWLAPVGSFPAGAGRWGQLDMLGNLAEHVSVVGGDYTCGGSFSSLRGVGKLANGQADVIDLAKHECPAAPDGIRCAADPRQP